MVGLLELSTISLVPLHCPAALRQLGTQAGVLCAQIVCPQLEEAEGAAQVLHCSWAGFAGGQRLVRRHGVCPLTPEPAQLCLGRASQRVLIPQPAQVPQNVFALLLDDGAAPPASGGQLQAA